MTIETVKLKNGTIEAEGLVSVMMFSLRNLLQESPITFYELVMKCRDRDHQFWSDTLKSLQDLHLIQQDGKVHDSIRNIVLSAVEGEMSEMTLGSPLPVKE